MNKIKLAFSVSEIVTGICRSIQFKNQSCLKVENFIAQVNSNKHNQYKSSVQRTRSQSVSTHKTVWRYHNSIRFIRQGIASVLMFLLQRLFLSKEKFRAKLMGEGTQTHDGKLGRYISNHRCNFACNCQWNTKIELITLGKTAANLFNS